MSGLSPDSRPVAGILNGMTPTRRRRGRMLPAAAALGSLAASLLLGGCSHDDGGSGGDHGKSALHQPVERSPLTGLPFKGKPPKHPVVAVKIDNSASSAPQVGLASADMVTEELVEGGITRLAAFFDTTVPGVVGPVRSMRATDIGIVKPLDATLVASGGAAPTVTRVKDAGITFYTEGAPGFYRDSGRYAPYNLFMRLPELVKTLDESKRPSPYLPFGSASSLPKGSPAHGLTATFSPSSSTSFAYQGGHYVNTNSHAASGDQFTPDTVLVLRVKVGDAGYLDPAGNPVPETDFTGQGDAMVFHGGRLVRGTWTKAGLDADVGLRSDGKALRLPPGKVWIELVPADGGSVSVTQ